MINRKIILSLVVVLTMTTLFLPIAIVTNTNTDSKFTKNKELKSERQILPGLVPHDPIIVNEDADFETLGFSGDGSKSDPYLIENYQISTTFDNAIVVKKTTKHFIIRNCQLYSTGYTIFINNVAPGTCLIENNTLEGINSYTVYILSSDFVNITNNYFDVYRCGLNLEDSRYNIIANNTLIADSGYSSGSNNAALDLVQCFACKIINNSCDNFQMGFYIGSSANLILANNTIENMGDYSGMYIKDSVLLRIINNTIAVAPMLTGISMANTDNTTIIYNTIIECEFEGLDLNGNSEYNSIYYNNFINNSLGFPQAIDNGVNNIWFNTTYNEGNYWSDWIGSGNYSIAGTANSYDEYPLNSRTQADWSIITLPDITPAAEADDVYEQNDILANARTVALNSFISLKANDNDYYNMTVTDTTIVRIQIEYQEQIPFVLDLYLYNQWYQQINTTLNKQSKEIILNANYNGSYYIGIRPGSFNLGIDYNLTILATTETLLIDDRYENNDVLLTAAPVELNKSTYFTLNDDDFFTFKVPKDYRLKFTFYFETMGDLVVGYYVYDVNGGEIFSYEDTTIPSFTFTTDFDETTRLFARIEYVSGTKGMIGRITPNTYPIPIINEDEYEENDNFASAALLETNTLYNLAALDDDYFKVEMQEGDYLNIILTQYYSSPNLDLYLYDEDQNTIDFNWSSYDTKTLNHTCEYTGIYYIKVDKFGFLEENKYTLQLIGPQKTTPTPTAGFLFIPIILATLPLVYIIRKRKLNK